MPAIRVRDLRKSYGTIEAVRGVVVRSPDPTATLHVLSWALERGIVLDGLTVARPTLEDVYLELTARAADG